jgi:hypothetical protein
MKAEVVPPNSLLSDYSDNGYALRKVIPVGNLPPSIRFTKDDVSLVPDTTDRTGAPRFGKAEPYIVVYLVNDTDETIPRIIGELHKVYSEVSIGGRWYPRESMRMACGSVPEPQDLPPRSALALGGLSERRGDMYGEIRYAFDIPGRRIESDPMRGRYVMAEVEGRMPDALYQSELWVALTAGLVNRRWDELEIATDPEEFCALMEICRHYRMSIPERAALIDWMLRVSSRHGATAVETRAMKRIKSLLSKPWLVDNDGQALADRCIAALEAPSSRGYGTPEKCKAVVWRFLANQRGIPYTRQWENRNSKPVSEASLIRLVELAKESLDSGDEVLGDGAAGFLASRMVTEAMYPTEDLFAFLNSGREKRVHAGLSGLASRSRMREAIPWLISRMEASDPHLPGYYRRYLFRMGHKEMKKSAGFEAWETELVIHLFENDPLETLETLSVYGAGWRMGKPNEDFAGKLRAFLQGELSEKRKRWWRDATELDMLGRLERSREVNCQALGHGIRLLDALDDPADVPLLQALLAHPAANANIASDGSGTMFFTARYEAAHCLRRRKIAVPETLVTQIPIKPHAPSRDRTEDFMRFVLRHEWAIKGSGLAVLLCSLFYLWRRTSRCDNPASPPAPVG